jgi:signal recognition particle receptor subunit beta
MQGSQYSFRQSTLHHTMLILHVETTTVALDYGKVVMHGFTGSLFGKSGHERFEFARRIIREGMGAALLLVDCTCAVDDFTKSLYHDLVAS